MDKVAPVITNSNISPPIPVVKRPNKFFRFIISFFSILVIISTVTTTLLFFLVYIPAKNLYQEALTLQTDVQNIQTSISNKDLKELRTNLDKTKNKIGSLKSKFDKFSYLSAVPYAKEYYQDGTSLFKISDSIFKSTEIVISAIEPYQDFLGLKGSSTSASKTTEDRIAFLTESVESLTPHIDTLEKEVTNIKDTLNTIDPNRYPEDFRGINLKSVILKSQETVSQLGTFLANGKPILTKTSWLLGKDAPRTYLLLFQNDAELRPTGGFWTAFATVKVDKGKVTPLGSDDIYTLDAKVNSTIPAPRPIKSYHINVPYWYVRDMNLSPDFPTSVDLFLQNYKKAYGSKNKIDAVIAIDTQVLVSIVEIIGRVGVAGLGNFDATPDKRCDGCPQIIYQLEWIAGRPRNYIETDRKGFLGPLMNNILANVMGAEKSKIGPLAESFVKNIYQKHILFYFDSEDIQTAAVKANMAGTITPIDQYTDYFHLNDANISSNKTNLFINQKIKHEIRTNNGKIEHKVSITYTNPSRASNCNLEKGDLCLNAPRYRNWFRFYTPKGSTLTKMTGTEVDPLLYEEFNKQVFEGFYGNKYPLYAQNSTKVTVQYQSGVTISPNYSLLLQKQPGTKPIEYEIYFNGEKIEEFSWVADKTIKLPL